MNSFAQTESESLYTIYRASGFSSRVSTAIGNEVLISSSNCAAAVAISTNITEQLTIYWPYITKRMSSYANYAQQCYGSSSDSEQCNTFVTKQLNAQITRNASCPFSAEMCRTPDRNILFDTGLLDTHAGLGFNAPPSRRFLYRRTTHCAPLVADGYRRVSNFTAPDDPNFSTPYAKYYYGPRNSDVNETATYKYPLLNRFQAADRKTLSAASDYSIGSVEAWSTNTTFASHSSFTPIRALLSPDASNTTTTTTTNGDIALLFLSANDIAYTTPVADPLYATSPQPGGHFYVPATGADGLALPDAQRSVPFYYRAEPAAPLGNFSLLGLALIYTIGGSIILASWLLEPIVGCWQKRRGADYARLEWCANDTLHLQRLAHEELGFGTWTDCDREIPVTEKGELLGV
ncbi:hypothetical protein UCDDS831_g07054 [Diplodia seriata]|uniref:Uncharacterized protein n=1 Tax=Diplodia seriata TaxID=420778 RepID=A0A0G2GHE4_9PEZI|nr:hypothetical protein UCDDS831_g07054 [Diplodia seriata]